MEIWKDIPDYENKYQISNYGNVRNINKNRNLKPSPNIKGYMRVNLWKRGNYSTKLVHRLVSNAFIPNPENKPQVNHIDGNKANNIVSNLEWNTNTENIQHAYDNKLILGNSGEKNGRCVTNHDTVCGIITLLQKCESRKNIAETFGVTIHIVNNIKNRKSWKHLTRNIIWQE